MDPATSPETQPLYSPVLPALSPEETHHLALPKAIATATFLSGTFSFLLLLGLPHSYKGALP